MLLGTLLRQLQDERRVTQMLFDLGDITLAGRVADAAARYGESDGEYAAGACARFSDSASDEDWLALMTAIERSADPAVTCLRTMLDWSLKSDAEAAAKAEAAASGHAHSGCGCGGGGCSGEAHGPG